LLIGLVWRPELSLLILWTILIPLVPASLLLSPLIWRNVCPLATLNMLSSAREGRVRRKQTKNTAVVVTSMGIVLFLLMVPARRFLFNTEGIPLAATIAIVALLAILLGAAYDMKAGFCNALCPVLPVERLYGQSPLLTVSNQRCRVCTACSAACIDISPHRAVSQQLGNSGGSLAWIAKPFGLFAAAFPGFVFGYFTIADGPLAAAWSVYLHVGAWAAVSGLGIVAVTLAFKLRSAVVLPVVAAVAVGIYYWYAFPPFTEAIGLGAVTARGGQIVLLILISVWLLRALRTGPNGSQVPAGGAVPRRTHSLTTPRRRSQRFE
jgi:hypothetical protein